MKPMRNYIVSTTRMWNCGDDFIAFGVKNILNHLLKDSFNLVAYNRNPDLHLQRTRYSTINVKTQENTFKIDLNEYIKKTNFNYDNSWHPRISLNHFDGCIFAGTPEWFGGMVEPLTKSLNDHPIPVYYLGIGGFERREHLKYENLPSIDRNILSSAKLITVRDTQTETLLKPVNPIKLPCPALFSAASEQKRSRKKKKFLKLALSTQPVKSLQPPSSPGTYEYSISLFKELISKFDCEIVCHYVDEINPLSELGIPVRYSYDAKDYIDIYSKYDLLITTRVHGAGLAASLGIPSFVIQHSARSETANGFLSKPISPKIDTPEIVIEKIQNENLMAWSNEILDHKNVSFERYCALLTPIFQ